MSQHRSHSGIWTELVQVLNLLKGHCACLNLILFCPKCEVDVLRELGLAICLAISVKEIFVKAVLSEVCVLFLNEKFERQYVHKFEEILLEYVFLVAIDGDNHFILYLLLILIVFFLEFIVCHLKGSTELFYPPEAGDTCHLVDLWGKHGYV